MRDEDNYIINNNENLNDYIYDELNIDDIIKNDVFNIAIVGNIHSGKTTLIQDILLNISEKSNDSYSYIVFNNNRYTYRPYYEKITKYIYNNFTNYDDVISKIKKEQESNPKKIIIVFDALYIQKSNSKYIDIIKNNKSYNLSTITAISYDNMFKQLRESMDYVCHFNEPFIPIVKHIYEHYCEDKIEDFTIFYKLFKNTTTNYRTIWFTKNKYYYYLAFCDDKSMNENLLDSDDFNIKKLEYLNNCDKDSDKDSVKDDGNYSDDIENYKKKTNNLWNNGDFGEKDINPVTILNKIIDCNMMALKLLQS
jgi:hypothetical protein